VQSKNTLGYDDAIKIYTFVIAESDCF